VLERIHRSWGLFKEAWAVLRQDRELLLFPVLSGIASCVVLAGFLTPLLLTLPWGEIMQAGSGSQGVHIEWGPLHYAGTFLYYLVSYFVVVFFNAGLVACVKKRFAGDDPTLSDGLQFSFSHLGLIFKWALLSATVGMVLRLIEERANWLGQIVINLIGLLWSLATMFVVPVLVYERVGPFTALKRSAETFKKAWGEAVVANFGMSTVTGLLALVGMVILLLGSVGGGMLVGAMGGPVWLPILLSAAVALLYWVGLAIVHSSVQGIFMTACYEYASTGEVPSAFTKELVTRAWRPKK